MNKEAIDLILEQNPLLKNKREVLEALKEGSYCWHHSWGVGCIQGEDEANRRIIIKFDSQTEPRSMDPVFCVQKLNIIPENHVLVEARKNPEMIRDLQKNNPCELAVKVLECSANHSASALEL